MANQLQSKIDIQYLAEINQRKINYPDFNAMGKLKMAQFIWHNSDIYKYKIIRNPTDLANERSELELEIWCKELYSKIQNALVSCLMSEPSSRITIIPYSEEHKSNFSINLPKCLHIRLYPIDSTVPTTSEE